MCMFYIYNDNTWNSNHISPYFTRELESHTNTLPTIISNKSSFSYLPLCLIIVLGHIENFVQGYQVWKDFDIIEVEEKILIVIMNCTINAT